MTPAILTTASPAAPGCLPSLSQPAAGAGETACKPLFVDIIGLLLVSDQPSAKPAPAAVSGAVIGSGEGLLVPPCSAGSVGTTTDTPAAEFLETTVPAENNGGETHKNDKEIQPDVLTSLLSIRPLAAMVAGCQLIGSSQPPQVEGAAPDLTGVEAQEGNSDGEPAQPTVQGRHRHGSCRIGKRSDPAGAKTPEDTCSLFADSAEAGGAGSGTGTLTGQEAAAVPGSLQVSIAAGNLPAICEPVRPGQNSAQGLVSATNDAREAAVCSVATGCVQSEFRAPSDLVRLQPSLPTGTDELNNNPVGDEKVADSANVNRFGGIHETVLADVTPRRDQTRMDVKPSFAPSETSQPVDDESVHSNALIPGGASKPETGSDRMLALLDCQQASAPSQRSSWLSRSLHRESTGPDALNVGATPVPQDAVAIANRRDNRIKGAGVMEALKPPTGGTEEVALSGTGDAVIGGAMKTQNELHTIAGSEENILPGGGETTFVRQTGKEPFGIRIGEKLSYSVLDALFVAHEAGPAHQPMPQPIAGTSDNAVPAAGSTQFSVEKLTHQVMDRVVTFKSLYQDHMAVMVRPDEHTELRLQFTLKTDGVDVSARVERGDFNTLQASWGQLQQTLADHGVHMGELSRPLSNANDLSQSGSGANMGDAQERAPRHRPRLNEELTEELVGAGAMTEAVHVRLHNSPRVMPRRWEKWA